MLHIFLKQDDEDHLIPDFTLKHMFVQAIWAAVG